MKISGFQFLHSKAETAKVIGVDFTIMPEEEIDAWTNAEIYKYESFQREQESGINDPRMGVQLFKEKCKTCSQNNECPGHFGRIKLERKIYHINFITTIKQILLCICHKCGTLRKPSIKEDENGNPRNDGEVSKKVKYQQILQIPNSKKRLSELYKMLGKVNQCSSIGCLEKLYTKITIEKYLELWLWKKSDQSKSSIESQKTQWSAEETYNILKKIPKQTAIDLLHNKENKKFKSEYFLHPKDLILSRIFVPPPQVRPFIELQSTFVCQDEMTKCYQKIVKLNQEIKQGNVNEKEHVELIQNIVARMIDNQKPKLPSLKIKTKTIKSFSQRLSGKEGRFRQNLMGKRVDFSARTVISPDANLALDELGVPRSIADTLTVPEIVNQQNINMIKQLWNDGKIKYVMKPNKIKQIYEGFDAIISNSARNIIEEHINDGVIIERTLQDGDFVLFNRQPTLHKMSMMGHKVKILPWSTFRLNLSVCTPYNADFDGDEMNLHVPQSYETRAEIKHVCHVPRQIITPKSNKPVMGLVQDSLLGISLFTLRDCFVKRKNLFNLIMWIDNWEGEIPMPAILKPEKLWSGKQVISMLIPNRISMMKIGGKNSDDERWFSIKDDSIYIYKGELLQGYMTKAIVGDSPGGLVHLIWLDIGTQATCDFITRSQRIINNWLIMQGHTISCQDIVPSEICQKEMEKIKGQAFIAFENALNDFQDAKKIEDMGLHKSGKRIFDSFEVYINSILNKLRGIAEKKCRETTNFRLNQFNKMVWAGSKGKPTNLAQVMGFVGQQNIEGARIGNGFIRRTLPHFTKDDNGILARGFITSNFFQGLRPFEFFFHMMGGREGLSDTAVKTSRTGYIQRKLIKALEDVIVKYDGTVRDSNGTIIQTSYGEDGLAGEFIESQRITEVELSNEVFEKEFRFLKDLDNQKIVVRHKISPEKFEQILQEVEFKYKQAISHPGEAIGAIAAQSIGEPTTQMTLNTFHFAGVSDRNVTLGVPRLQEILDASKKMKTPECRIYFEENLQSIEAKQIMRQQIEYQEVQKYILQTTILYYKQDEDNIFDEDEEEEEEDDENQINQKEYKKLESWKLIFKLDKRNPYISLLEVEKSLTNLYISGIKKIDKVYPTEKENQHNFDSKNGKQIKDKEIIFITSGSNLKQILKIPGINPFLTYTNNLQEISESLGIEAARRSIINELREVIEPYDLYINYRHLSILADWMTLRGRITPINRMGINKIVNLSCLRKASFEETVDILNNAAIFCQKDKLAGITENIIFGQYCDLGTGCFDLLIDQQKVVDFKTKRDINYFPFYEDENHSPNAKTPIQYLNTPVYPFTPGNAVLTPGYAFSVHQNMGSFTPSSPHQNIGYSPFINSNTPMYPNAIKSNNQPLYANSSFYSTEEKNLSPIISPNYSKSIISPNNSFALNSSRSIGYSPYELQDGYKRTPSIFNSPTYQSQQDISYLQKISPQYDINFQLKTNTYIKQEITQIQEEDDDSEFESDSDEN
ncbi:RNA polymerase domain 2 family protein [Ichthyophthirius multifiliis]|uniref:DNA-directed RNA polymerase subunit n=1 Tax=Ichthyophthirius multifiliis TaxID=5932 RepID=G0QZU1_ICHMU|nr:RNA polymerase domain 2 family protein [Ichthyophthirius multifiliis]EGR29261.1 RNA polymerase domain 2 family protein [Ichthyophthirius multifiliis]|eukprot:XP_004030497.1 RNA polymerase domain 2 family protein [Ichthyophthirius multifiliis]